MFKIIVDTEEEKQQFLEASRYIHDFRGIDPNIAGVNDIAHLYAAPQNIEVKAAVSDEKIPEELTQWIEAFCTNKLSVTVGHRMFSTKENLTNLKLPYALDLIRTHPPIEAFINKDDVKMSLVAAFAAKTISDVVIKTFKTASYPGD